jgi:YidC/Oxa1 family membrane protein insertase
MFNPWNTLIINPSVNLLLWIYDLLANNFGLAIIVFTILIRLVTYPLTAQQMKGAQAMQDLQKDEEWKEIQAKYKKDREKLAAEQMRIYKERGISPFGSCLPTLIQFPIIIGLYQAIIRCLAVTPTQMFDLTTHIYPFIPAAALIPLNNTFLWMNLSQPERLYIPGIAIGIPVLAIFVVITTYMQSKLMTPPAQPGEQGAQMAQAMNLYMPFLMGWLAYSFSSGLALYFIVSNVFTIAQYAVMGKLNWHNLLPSRFSLMPGIKPELPAGNPKTSPGKTKSSTGSTKSSSSKTKSSSSKAKPSSSKSKS